MIVEHYPSRDSFWRKHFSKKHDIGEFHNRKREFSAFFVYFMVERVFWTKSANKRLSFLIISVIFWVFCKFMSVVPLKRCFLIFEVETRELFIKFFLNRVWRALEMKSRSLKSTMGNPITSDRFFFRILS